MRCWPRFADKHSPPGARDGSTADHRAQEQTHTVCRITALLVGPRQRRDHSATIAEGKFFASAIASRDSVLRRSITRYVGYGALMRCAAPSSASFGFCRPWVMLPSADSIADQNRLISGRLGISMPVLMFAIVATINGSAARLL